MSLSTKTIDRLFQRLSATYGASWDRAMGNAPLSDVKSAWAHELSGFAGHLDSLAWALENLPETAPNVLQFRSLCRRAPAPDVPRIETPKADPALVAAELAKLAPLKATAARGSYDHKAWAKRHIANHEAGLNVRPITLKFAREALGIKEAA